MKVASVVRRAKMAPCRYVALGDGFTEGVGDPDRQLPNGVRGWADRVAEGLAAAAPGWQYANLAVRGRRLSALIAEQLPPALEMEPTLVSVSVGSVDILVSSTKQVAMLDRFEFVVSVLAETGATVVLFASPDSSPAAQPDDRIVLHNTAVERIARTHGAVLVDPWVDIRFRDQRMWDAHGEHPSRAGHGEVARRVLEVLGVAPVEDAEPGVGGRRTAAVSGGSAWVRQMRNWLAPSQAGPAGRDGQLLAPRWPVPTEVPARGGLRSLHRMSESQRASQDAAAHRVR
jgi:lysophospholipase L1-like esterase